MSRPAPPGADPNLWAWFTAFDLDGSGQITASELQQMLLKYQGVPYNTETIRLLVNMHDSNQSGAVDFAEFASLWNYLVQWGSCFRQFDRDGSGTIDKAELASAFLAFGYRLTDDLVGLLIKKYDKFGTQHPAGSQGNNSITLDSFIQACVQIQTLTNSFRKYDTTGTGYIQLGYQDFLRLVLTQTTK